MTMVYVKPREGGRVRMPDRNFKLMPEEGATVSRGDYYERLIIGGDLIITEPPPTESASAHELQGTGDDPGAAGHELQGRASAGTASVSEPPKGGSVVSAPSKEI